MRKHEQDGYIIIFVKAYRHRNGKWMVASHYGLEAFPLKVKVDRRRKK